MDIKAAYLQATGFTREIYIRPPREAKEDGVLWQLLAAAYGLTESGRLWYLTSNTALIHKHGLTRCKYDHTLYYAINDLGVLEFILAVQVDDYTYSGTPARMQAFEEFLRRTFEISKIARRSLSLMGCTITQDDDFSVTLSQESSLQALDPSVLTDAAGTAKDGPTSAKQSTAYRTIIGQMLYIGRLSAPLMLCHASDAATKQSDLRIHHLRSLAATIQLLKKDGALLRFLAPNRDSTLRSPHVLDAITDGLGRAKGQRRLPPFPPIRFDRPPHPLGSPKTEERIQEQRHCRTSGGRRRSLARTIHARHHRRCHRHRPPTDLTVYATSLQSLSTTIREPEERRNKIDLAAIREAYDICELNSVRWCPGPKLLADPLTKDNRKTAALLLHALSTGTHVRPFEMTVNLGYYGPLPPRQ